MKPTKKTLRRRANMLYTSAIAAGIASLLVASGIETAASFGGMIGYSLAAVAVFALTLPCVECARRLEIEADRIGRPVHRQHARPDEHWEEAANR
ncbi:MAG: hypothetical protein KH706_07505 [Faecalibacterium prausnitzii]|nr:hypothetical protein [Faecalibacterium prausnitzii]